MEKQGLSLVILAGGQGRRMGWPKASLLFHGQPMLTRMLQRLEALSGDIVVVTMDGLAPVALPPDVHLAKDVLPGEGPLSAAVAGLRLAESPLAALLSCDLPFVSPDVLTALVGLLSPGSDAVVPVVSGRRQPLHAVYRVATVEKAGRLALSKGIRSMDGLLGSSLRVTWADDREMAGIPGWRDSCTNVNTPEELARARRRKRG